jgi:putative DNA primase/helicase
MLAYFVGPDREAFTLHATYLDATGRKAAVPEVKKLAPLPVPAGGAVRLAPSAETMGIAEGIETALSASQLHGIPVWSALSSGGLMKWQPPETAKHIIVCGDHDTSFAGQLAAFSLAHRLRLEKRDGIPRWGRIEVRCPGINIEADLEDTDWNDLLDQSAKRMEAAE